MSMSGMPAEWFGLEEAFRGVLSYSLGGVAVTVIVAALHLGSHLKNYSRPRLQRHVVRIIFMTPICEYSTGSVPSAEQYSSTRATLIALYP
jgi:hypothetical protein